MFVNLKAAPFLLLLGFSLCGTAAMAYRVEFVTTVLGERWAGSEICLYQGRDLDGPASLFFSSDDVRCLPADQIIDMPAGVWSFFARHPDGWVSAHGAALTRRGPAQPDSGYQSVRIVLEPAAFIDFKNVPPDQDRFAVYVPISGDPTRSPAAFPLARSELLLSVPAGRPFLVLRIRNGKPIGAGPLSVAQAAQTLDARNLIPPADQRDLIAWIKVDDPSWEEMLEVASPRVHLLDEHGRTHSPLFHIEGSGGAHESLVVFQKVPPGDYSLAAESEDWTGTPRSVRLTEDSAGTFIDEPLIVHLKHRAIVTWPRSPGGRSPVRDALCSGEAIAHERWSIRLLACDHWQPATSPSSQNLDRCSVKREEVVEPGETGRAIFDLARPGSFIAELRVGTSTAGVAAVLIPKKETVTIDLQVAWPFVFGRVSEGGAPVHAVVRFATGAAISDALGNYEALLERDPLDNSVEVIPCDGSEPFDYFPPTPIAGTGRHDIRIPGNKIRVSVVDAQNGEPLGGARIGRGLFETRKEAEGSQMTPDIPLENEGTTTLRRFAAGYYLRICAGAEGYHPIVCAKPISIDEDTTADVTLRLRARTLRHGRVSVTAPVIAGALFRVTAEGSIVETSEVESDGRFSFTGDSAAQYLVFSSANHPLFIARHPATSEDEELEVTVPAGRVRQFTVESSSGRSGWMTIAIDGLTIHPNILARHLTRRGASGFLHEGGPARVPEILESGPLSVIVVMDEAALTTAVPDLFLLPQHAVLREIHLVPASGRVIVGPP